MASLTVKVLEMRTWPPVLAGLVHMEGGVVRGQSVSIFLTRYSVPGIMVPLPVQMVLTSSTACTGSTPGASPTQPWVSPSLTATPASAS